MGGLITVTPPADAPITLAELKLAGGIDTTAEDLHLEILRFAASDFYEKWTGLQLVRTTFAWTEISFLGAIAAQRGILDFNERSNSRFFHTHPPFHSFGFHSTLDHDFRLIELPKPPLIAVNQVTYFDVDGVQQTFPATDFGVDVSTKVGVFFLNEDKEWPDVQRRERAGITVDFDCGFATPAAVPQLHKFAILDLALHWFENREAVVIDERVTVKSVPLSFERVVALQKITRL